MPEVISPPPAGIFISGFNVREFDGDSLLIYMLNVL